MQMNTFIIMSNILWVVSSLFKLYWTNAMISPRVYGRGFAVMFNQFKTEFIFAAFMLRQSCLLLIPN